MVFPPHTHTLFWFGASSADGAQNVAERRRMGVRGRIGAGLRPSRWTRRPLGLGCLGLT